MVPPLIAFHPFLLLPMFTNFVPPLKCNRPKLPLVDLPTNSHGALATTVPRWATNVWVWNCATAIVLTVTVLLITTNDCCCCVFQLSMAHDMPCCQLIDVLVYPADAAS